MFAQLFDAAKRAISRTPSYQGRSSETRDEVPDQVPEVPTSDASTAPADSTDIAKMVTTRRGTETPSLATPASSAKKRVGKRELEALDTPTQAKRQRKTVVEVTRNLRSTPRKGEATQESADEAVSETEEATPKAGKTSPLAIRRRSSPKVIVEPSSPVTADAPTQEGFHTPEPASSEAAFVTPFTSKKAPVGSPTPKATKTETPASAKKARGRPKKAQKDEEADEIPSSTQESSAASPTTAAPAKAHVRFGSEEPSVNAKGHTRYEAPAPAPAPAQEDDEDSASDSDEAPEQVSTSAAASVLAASKAETARALAAAQEKERRKREARESRIAAEQTAKRERDALKAAKAAAREKKAPRLSSIVEAEGASDEEDEHTAPTTFNRSTLPSLLPDSLLDSLSAERPPTPPPETKGKTDEQLRREKLNHHIKFLESSSKAPKDRRVGKHHVAVLGGQKHGLAPKVSRGTKGVREGWLKGRQGQGVRGKPKIGKTQRVKFGGGGFLRGED